MGVLLGGLASVFYGVGDFLGGEGAKRASAPSIVFWAALFSLPLVTVVALAGGGRATLGDFGLGAAAGAAGTLGLVALFAGLGRGHAAAVAPASAALAGIFPVAVAVLGGERPTLLAWLGVSLAIPAIALSSSVANPGEVRWGGLPFGLMAGLGFGGYTVIIDLTGPDSRLLPLIPARGAAMVVILVVATLGWWRVAGFAAIPLLIVIGNGVLDVAGNVALLLGLRHGSLALVAVAASFYPAVTVAMARLVNGEVLRGRQVLGVGLALVALAAISLG